MYFGRLRGMSDPLLSTLWLFNGTVFCTLLSSINLLRARFRNEVDRINCHKHLLY